MPNFSEKDLDRIFSKGRIINGLDPKSWRLDASDAIICRSSYGRDDEFFGWEVDHVVPKSMLEAAKVPEALIDYEQNLRPLNWNNNNSKGNDYPTYTTVIVSLDDGKSNCKKKGRRTVNKFKQLQLKKLYVDYLQL